MAKVIGIEFNKDAVAIAKHFFEVKTDIKCTPRLMVMGISQAKTLLIAGYTADEINKAIDWCIVHPPKKGFNSIAWLQYDMANILNKVMAKEVNAEINKIEHVVGGSENEDPERHRRTADSSRYGKTVDIELFK